MTSPFHAAFALVGLSLAAGCTQQAAPQQDLDAGPSDSSVDVVCAEGLKKHRTACVPVFDKCGKDEVPLLGGGCKRVGVEMCDGGIKGPPDWECTPVGQPPQIACPTGWTKNAQGWCDPVLPAAACSQGTMEVIGKATCQPIGECGAGTYGNIQLTSTTIHVDQSFKGGGSDGTAATPYTTIDQALQAVASGGHIAVAAGEYTEDLSIDKPVVLEGRCAAMVKLTGQGQNTYAAIEINSSDVQVHGITVTGPDRGVRVSQATNVQLGQVAVQSCGAEGVFLSGAEVTLDHCVVGGNKEVGMYLSDSVATLDRAVVRDTQSLTINGDGIEAVRSSKPSVLTLRDCLIDNNMTTGLLLWGSKATVERTVVRNTQPRPSDGDLGVGIYADRKTDPSTLTVRDSLISGNQITGILSWGASIEVDSTAISDNGSSGIFADVDTVSSTLKLTDCLVHNNKEDGIDLRGSHVEAHSTVVTGNGHGIYAGVNTVPSTVKMIDCLVDDNKGGGINLWGSSADLTRTVVARGIVPPGSDLAGSGIHLMYKNGPATLAMTDCIVKQSLDIGIVLWGSKATLERTVVRDTQPRPKDMGGGWGVAVRRELIDLDPITYGKTPSELTMKSCLIDNNMAAGIQIQGCMATLRQTIVRNTRLYAGVKYGHGITAEEHDYPATLTLQDCVVANNASAGLSMFRAKALLERTVVLDTQSANGKGGLGMAYFGGGPTASYDLAVRECVIDNNRSVGISMVSSSATIERSVVRNTQPAEASGQYGDGIEVGLTGADLTLVDSLIDNNERAGLMFWRAAKGTIRRSVFSGADFAIDLEDGTAPVIEDSNVYEDNGRDGVAFGEKLNPAPIPEVPKL